MSDVLESAEAARRAAYLVSRGLCPYCEEPARDTVFGVYVHEDGAREEFHTPPDSDLHKPDCRRPRLPCRKCKTYPCSWRSR